MASPEAAISHRESPIYGHRTPFVVILAILVLVSCRVRTNEQVPNGTDTPAPPTGTPSGGIAEYPVTTIPLAGPVAASNAEVSGLAWYGDHLIMLPQYPQRISPQDDGALLALARADILAYLDGQDNGPLEPRQVRFAAPGLSDAVKRFEGYEAIAFRGDQAFLTIEVRTRDGMRGYLVSGQMAPDLSALTVDVEHVAEIQPQTDISNLSDEALLVVGDTIVSLYEANGVDVNPSPAAHLFDTDLAPAGTIPFPDIPYRVTDATTLDEENRFWAINYFFPGQPALLPRVDPLAQRFGQGPTHQRYVHVERLVELQFTPSGIRLAETSPIQLVLSPGTGRNWEGLVRLDGRGFLLMTDEFPDTILAFVPSPP